jgi:hypothetical protein
MALSVTVVGKRNVGDRRAQLVDFAFDGSDSGGEAFAPADVALHEVDLVVPEPVENSGTYSVSFDHANELAFLTVAAAATTGETQTVRALVFGI